MRAPGGILAALLILAAIPAQAEPVRADSDQQLDPFHVVALLDRRVQSIGWRLAQANARFCKTTMQSTGLLVQDLQSWKRPDAARTAFDVDPSVQVIVGAVAEGSPAADAGLTTGEPIYTIGDTVLDSDLPPAVPGTFARQVQLLDRVDGLANRNGWLALGVDNAEDERTLLRIPARPVCASRFEIVTDGKRAQADGIRVLVSAEMALGLADDDQLAFVIAHELAHNALGHPQMLKREGRKWGRVRHTEREADRLAIWLMRNAEYDVGGARAFMLGWARSHDVGFLDPTHDAWDERLNGVDEEIALVAASPARPGEYDWSVRFPLDRAVAKPGG
ncbi:M48 family metalloprotease [Croceicoccus naphthovorans]|uniref:M48 family metalloprotease n=1 Tax=Croceicoccus naphthovorans TaxID=1348774 RepID=UPI00069EE641|nr:M48 family metalloprotease [Croceicoccus naphthovorans]MBB3989420.1 hypothetical protein [Croceicoccus naphthovorans]